MTEGPTTNGGVNTIPASMPSKLAEACDVAKDGAKDANTSRVLVP